MDTEKSTQADRQGSPPEKIKAQKLEALAIEESKAGAVNPSNDGNRGIIKKASNDLAKKRNSAHPIASDIAVQNWSAQDIAQQSPYEDEATIKAQIKEGRKKNEV